MLCQKRVAHLTIQTVISLIRDTLRSVDNLHYEKFSDGSVKCIEDEIPFDVPEGWAWSRLHSLSVKIGAGSTPTGGAAVYSTSGIIFIRSQNVYNDGLILTDVAYISEEINQKKLGSIVKPKDILLNITGGSIGRCALVPDEFDIANVNQHVMIIRLANFELRKYIHCVITSSYIQKQILSRQVGSGRGGLSAETLSTFLIPLPPINEQISIMGRLNNCISQVLTISNAQCKIADLISIVKSKILDLAIHGKLVPQDPNDESASVLLERIRAEKEELIKQGKRKRNKRESVIFKGDDNSYYQDLPETWELVNFKDCITLISGRDLGKDEYNSDSIGIPYITGASNFINGNIQINRWTPVPKTISIENDILITCKGTVGELAINKYGEIHIARQIMAIRVYKNINIEYTKLFLESIIIEIKNAANGLIPGISRDDMLGLSIPLPPLAEQKRIVETTKKTVAKLDEIVHQVL